MFAATNRGEGSVQIAVNERRVRRRRPYVLTVIGGGKTHHEALPNERIRFSIAQLMRRQLRV